MLAYVGKVFFRFELCEFSAAGIDYSDFAVVKVDLIVIVHQAHVIGVHGVSITLNHLNVLRVSKHNVMKNL